LATFTLATKPTHDTTASVRLVQITDPHLYADSNGVLVGMNCEEGLQDVLSLIRNEQSNLAAALCTGDISQDNSEASYQRFFDAVASLGIPQYWIPGNHDEVQIMKQAVSRDNPCFKRSFQLAGWRIVMLNTHVDGKVYGELNAQELRFLEQELIAAGHQHVLICLHHNCLPVDAAWLQNHALVNSDQLLELIDRHPQVRGVVFGHIHQEYERSRNSVKYLGSPSTCIQFHPSNNAFALDHRNPGYRWLELCSDGAIVTGVSRVKDKQYQIDFSGIGY
jgi:Icc protein